MAGPAETLGVLLAGGASRRYGSPKALAEVGGRALFERGLATLDAAAGRSVIVANRPDLFRSSGRDVRADVRPGLGALGGILTAVTWAAEEDAQVALVLACDMPFVPPGLARALVARAGRQRVVVPESGGPRGVEPLCAAYGVECLEPIVRALDRGDRAVISFFAEVEVCRLPLADVQEAGDPERMFFNLNRPEERRRAEELAASAEPGSGEGPDE